MWLGTSNRAALLICRPAFSYAGDISAHRWIIRNVPPTCAMTKTRTEEHEQQENQEGAADDI